MSDIRNTIKWADYTWNPVFGCKNGCPYCYARQIAKRFAKQYGRFWNIPAETFERFEPVWIEKNFEKEFPKWVTHIFVNSMSEISFWEQEWIDKVAARIRKTKKVKFLFLSQTTIFRDFPRNAYFGNTITTQSDYLHSVHTEYDFYSIEPIHERIDLNANSLNRRLKQIIVGAETGNRKGKIIPKAAWIEEIRIFCQKNNIKLFEKDSLKKIVNRELIQERI